MKCLGVADIPALEHALRKAKDQVTDARNPKVLRARERLVEDLEKILTIARAAVSEMERRQ